MNTQSATCLHTFTISPIDPDGRKTTTNFNLVHHFFDIIKYF